LSREFVIHGVTVEPDKYLQSPQPNAEVMYAVAFLFRMGNFFLISADLLQAIIDQGSESLPCRHIGINPDIRDSVCRTRYFASLQGGAIERHFALVS
jgi:hypothetical protein